MVALTIREQDNSLKEEIQHEVEELAMQFDELEIRLILNNDYDSRDAILAIHAGAGGTESQDWAEMLLRMYLMWAERKGFESQVVDILPGEEAGIKSVTFIVS